MKPGFYIIKVIFLFQRPANAKVWKRYWFSNDIINYSSYLLLPITNIKHQISSKTINIKYLRKSTFFKHAWILDFYTNLPLKKYLKQNMSFNEYYDVVTKIENWKQKNKFGGLILFYYMISYWKYS